MQGAGLVLTSYQDSLARVMDIVSNNVANITTTGYKRQEVSFDTYVVKPTLDDEFDFGVESGTYRDTSQGASVTTGNPLDVVIRGEGYFAVETPQGKRYTRAGAFVLNNDGEVVTPAGYRLLGDGDQAITLPQDASDVLIGTDGTITAKTGSAIAATQVGKMRAVKFENPQSLTVVGDGLYTAPQEGEPDDTSQFVQGAVEQSNVNSVKEMTLMIEISRNYQQALRLLDLENQRESNAISRLGKLSSS